MGVCVTMDTALLPSQGPLITGQNSLEYVWKKRSEPIFYSPHLPRYSSTLLLPYAWRSALGWGDERAELGALDLVRPLTSSD